MSATEFLGGKVKLFASDCFDVVRTLSDNSIDSVVTDPPYALVSTVKRGNSPRSKATENAYGRTGRGFMGCRWDNGAVGFSVEFWAEILRVLKPGGHIAAFGGTRTYHRLACAIEDAGFEIRDSLMWHYGEGFPKSLDVSKQLDLQEATEAARAWAGWGTALKPATEIIALARKPLGERTVAANVLKWGTGAINVDACRIAAAMDDYSHSGNARVGPPGDTWNAGNCRFSNTNQKPPHTLGRWPANVCHDGSAEVLALFPDLHGAGSAGYAKPRNRYDASSYQVTGGELFRVGDSGSAARFFYSAKADADDRVGSKHPTVKPLNLLRWLVRLITPPGGTTLDPFAGTGTTGEAAYLEGFSAVLIEREAEYCADIARRMAHVLAAPRERAQTRVTARGQMADAGPLFGEVAL